MIWEIYRSPVLLNRQNGEEGAQSKNGWDNRHGKLYTDSALLISYLSN